MDASRLFAQYSPADPQGNASPAFGTGTVIGLILVVIAFWRVFKKAEQPGWAAIIPIYSTIVLLKIIGRPWWWIFLFLVPFVNIVVAIVVALDVAKSFGKSKTFGIVGLFIFSIIGYLILGYGSAAYKGVPKH